MNSPAKCLTCGSDDPRKCGKNTSTPHWRRSSEVFGCYSDDWHREPAAQKKSVTVQREHSRQWWMEQGMKQERDRVRRKLRQIQKAENPRTREFLRHVIDIVVGARKVKP